MLDIIKLSIVPIIFLGVFLVSRLPDPVMTPDMQTMYQQHMRINTYILKFKPNAPAYRIALAIVQSAKECQIDPYLVTALMHTESTFQVDAESATGARGLMQIVKSTFESFGEPWAMAYDVELNVDKGACYLARHITTHKGRLDLALKRYNGNDDPAFARKVLARYSVLSDVYETTIIVKKGDTLAGIAATYLGDAGMYELIAEYNGISNPNLIEVGQLITIGGVAR